MRMTEIKALKLVKKWQEILALQDWVIIVFFKNKSKSKGASISPNYRYRKATLTIYNHQLNLEEYVLHELLHLIVGEYTALVFGLLQDRMTSQEASILNREEDRVVEKLTQIILRRGDRK